MKLKTISGLLAVIAGLCLCGGTLLAQPDNGGPGGLGGPGGPGGFGGPGGPGGANFDPAQFMQQMQQRMMTMYRTNLNITNDDEWSVIQPLVQKVMDAAQDAAAGRMGGFGRGGGGRGGQGGPGGQGGQGGGRGMFGAQPGPEQQALQSLLDAGAPTAQVKEALAKFRAARKEKQAKLEAAQADLQKVLTVKQEAQAAIMGLLP